MVDNLNDNSIDGGTSLSMVRHKIVFIGDVATGKTSIINRFLDNNFKDNYDVK
jgi:GTPase SAR1 family protein